MRRREFLRLAGLALAVGAANAACRTGLAMGENSASGSGRRVLVLGAGLAGLAAAKTLIQAGFEVQVLEGRGRLGGRTWTSTHWQDAPLDMGASWIHGTRGNPLTELAKLAGAELAQTDEENAWIYGPDGAELDEDGEERLEEIQDWLEEIIGEAQEGDEDQSVRAAVEAAARDEVYSAADRQMLEFLLNTILEHEYSGSVEQLSAYWYDDDEAFGGGDALLLEGYQRIVDSLAEGIPVGLNEVVQSVDWSGLGVVVKTNRGTHSGDLAVVCVPLGVLKAGDIQFTPALPARKRTAIDALGVGVLNKCYLRFEEVFWPAEADWLQHIPVERGEWTDWVSLTNAAGLPVLLGFNAADKGREMEAWTDTQIVASAMQTLRRMFGAGIPEPVDFQITRWWNDPMARGSYSFNALGSEPGMRDDLAEPLEGRLIFAGEATERKYFGTAHGAYLSGVRAGREVIQR